MDDTKEEKKKHKIEEESEVEESEEEPQPEIDPPLAEKESEENAKDDDVEEEEQESEEEENRDDEDEGEDIRKSEVLRRDLNQFVRDHQPNRLSGKLVTLILFILTIAVIGSAIYFVAGVGSPKKQDQTAISSPKSATTPTPSPTPKTLNRSQWSFEVLNGSGVTGAAKKMADSLKALGYQVVKVANADKDYTKNEFFVQEDLMVSIDSVVADIKDIIKIASISGKLKDSTASARIIIGKE